MVQIRAVLCRFSIDRSTAFRPTWVVDRIPVESPTHGWGQVGERVEAEERMRVYEVVERSSWVVDKMDRHIGAQVVDEGIARVEVSIRYPRILLTCRLDGICKTSIEACPERHAYWMIYVKRRKGLEGVRYEG